MPHSVPNLPDVDDIATTISDRYHDLLDMDGITREGWKDIANTVIVDIFGADAVIARRDAATYVSETFGVTGNLTASVNLQAVLRELGVDALSDNAIIRLAHLHRESGR